MEIFSLEWRAHRVELGDLNLKAVKLLLDEHDDRLLIQNDGRGNLNDLQATYLRAQALIAVAQAHYAAANVRVSTPRKEPDGRGN